MNTKITYFLVIFLVSSLIIYPKNSFNGIWLCNYQLDFSHSVSYTNSNGKLEKTIKIDSVFIPNFDLIEIQNKNNLLIIPILGSPKKIEYEFINDNTIEFKNKNGEFTAIIENGYLKVSKKDYPKNPWFYSRLDKPSISKKEIRKINSLSNISLTISNQDQEILNGLNYYLAPSLFPNIRIDYYLFPNNKLIMTRHNDTSSYTHSGWYYWDSYKNHQFLAIGDTISQNYNLFHIQTFKNNIISANTVLYKRIDNSPNIKKINFVIQPYKIVDQQKLKNLLLGEWACYEDIYPKSKLGEKEKQKFQIVFYEDCTFKIVKSYYQMISKNNGKLHEQIIRGNWNIGATGHYIELKDNFKLVNDKNYKLINRYFTIRFLDEESLIAYYELSDIFTTAREIKLVELKKIR